MKFSKVYSNKPELFGPIRFNSGLNVILGEIRLKENRDRDTHNLGKSTLGKLLDFGLLKGKSPNFFLFAHLPLFEDFVFLFELALDDGTFLTIARPVAAATKVSFKRHEVSDQDFDYENTIWDHADLAFAAAKELLDGILNWRAIDPWDFRNGISYFLRSQEDYQDVFQLGKFSGKHVNWKPFLAQIVGFDGIAVRKHYEKEADLQKKIGDEVFLRRELGNQTTDEGEIDSLLLLKREEVSKKKQQANSFDFRDPDKIETVKIVNEVDVEISELNNRRYSIQFSLRKIDAALNDEQILFNVDDAKELFREAGVLFQGQIAKDFEQLLAFNRAITEERKSYLKEERSELRAQLKEIEQRLDQLGRDRSLRLQHLDETQAFERYKQLSSEIVLLETDVAVLERKKETLSALKTLRDAIDQLRHEESALEVLVESNVRKVSEDRKSHFSNVRLFFNEIVEAVLSRKALLAVRLNTEGHLDFKAEILDESGKASSAGSGHTYLKLLCIAFDLAVLRAHLQTGFPRFVFHDGVFESLDDRKKENLLAVLREYTTYGIQSIITLIDSDLPDDSGQSLFTDDEIVLRLHDQGQSGRLFRMAPW